MKVSIKVNSEKLYQKIEKAIEYFKDAESRQLNRDKRTGAGAKDKFN